MSTENEEQTAKDRLFTEEQIEERKTRYSENGRYARAGRYVVPEMIFTNRLSESTYSTLAHFGVEAPGLLNDYACALEDALVRSLDERKELRQSIEELEIKAAKLSAKIKEYEPHYVDKDVDNIE